MFFYSKMIKITGLYNLIQIFKNAIIQPYFRLQNLVFSVSVALERKTSLCSNSGD